MPIGTNFGSGSLDRASQLRLVEKIEAGQCEHTEKTVRAIYLSHRPASFSVEEYDEWRDESLKSQFEQHFTWADIKGKPVLDFGCGAGALSAPCAKNGAQGAVGTDLSAKYIARANEHSSHNVRFILEQATDRISVP